MIMVSMEVRFLVARLEIVLSLPLSIRASTCCNESIASAFDAGNASMVVIRGVTCLVVSGNRHMSS